MGRAESRPRERQSRRLSFGLRRAAGASSLPFLARLPRAVVRLALALPLLAVLLPAGEARAQTDITLVSNTGQQAAVVGHGVLQLLAQGFHTGNNSAGYNLTSVGISIRTAISSPAVEVTLRKSASGLPGDVVYTFTNPTLVAGSVNTFTAPSGAVLSANTDYFVVIEETAGSVILQHTDSDAEDTGGAAGFSIADSLLECSDPCSSFTTSPHTPQIEVTGSLATGTANTAPTSADKTVTVEGSAYTFSALDFAFNDTDDGDTLDSVTIVTKPAKGTLALGGTDVEVGDSIPAASLGNLTFTPASGDSGTGYASFTFKVSDGTDLSASAYTMTIDVTPALPVVQFHVDDVTKTETERDGTFNIRVTLSASSTAYLGVPFIISPTGVNAATGCPSSLTVAQCRANGGYDYGLGAGIATVVPFSPRHYAGKSHDRPYRGHRRRTPRAGSRVRR